MPENDPPSAAPDLQIALQTEQLRYRASELETLLHLMPVGVAIASDPDCRTMRANDAFNRMLGLSSSQNPSKTADTASALPFRVMRNAVEVPAEDLPMQVAARTGATLEHTECEIVRDDGRTVFMHGHAQPLYDDDGKVRGSIGVFFDDTDRVALVRELRRSNDELASFSHVVSHDLQEPLRTMSVFAELLVRNPQSEDALRYTDHIKQAATRMNVLINGLLEYAKIGSFENLSAKTFHVDCNAALDEALQNLESAIAESGAFISRDPLPVVLADRHTLPQIFQNLIGNAIKYRGEQSPRVHIAVQKREREWLFSISDNGVGFDMRHAERIFQPFRRLDEARNDGAGVGLATCRRVIERAGGRIFAESTPGVGSTFFFTLPDTISAAAVA